MSDVGSAPAIAYDAVDLRVGDEPRAVAPGVWGVRFALPFALDHVNVWLLEDVPGWTVIDAGLADDPTRERWQQLLRGRLAGEQLMRLVATHFHPDHLGLAGWLCDLTGAGLWASHSEWLTGRWLAQDTTEGFVAAGREFDRRAGLAEDLVAARAARGNLYRRRVADPPSQFRRLRHGDRMEIDGTEWRIIVGVWPAEPEANPLADFLASLERFRELPDDCLVLPSHGLPFRGLQIRIDQLIRHHEERLEATLAACAEPATVVEVMPRLFNRPLDTHQLQFALGESLAHLNYLLAEGRLRRRLDGDGRFRYAAR